MWLPFPSLVHTLHLSCSCTLSADHRAGSVDGRGWPYYTIISLGKAVSVETLAVPLCYLGGIKTDGPYLPIKKSLRELQRRFGILDALYPR